MCVCMYVCTYMYICSKKYINRGYIDVCVYVCEYVHLWYIKLAYTYIYIYVYIYIYTYQVGMNVMSDFRVNIINEKTSASRNI